MGAWGSGIFEDDSTCDFVYEIEEAEDVPALLKSSFETAINAEYLDYDEGCAAIVSAALLDAVLHGTVFPGGEESFAPVVEANKNLALAPLKHSAVKALLCVLGQNDADSELNELWQENEEMYPQWRKNIEDIINRLK